MGKVVKFPAKSPIDKPANVNVPRTAREAAIRKKYPSGQGWKINSGKFAYEAAAETGGKALAKGALKVAGRVAGAIAGGPLVDLALMSEPAGEGSDKPSGPLMKGNADVSKTPGVKKSINQALKRMGNKPLSEKK